MLSSLLSSENPMFGELFSSELASRISDAIDGLVSGALTYVGEGIIIPISIDYYGGNDYWAYDFNLTIWDSEDNRIVNENLYSSSNLTHIDFEADPDDFSIGVYTIKIFNFYK